MYAQHNPIIATAEEISGLHLAIVPEGRLCALAAYDAAHYRFARTQSREMAAAAWDRPRAGLLRYLFWWLL